MPELRLPAVQWQQHRTPVGPVLLAATDDGLVGLTLHAGGVPFAPVLRRLKTRLRRDVVPRQGAGSASRTLGEAARQTDAYFGGELPAFSLRLDWSLTSGFCREVLQCLASEVARGRMVSYGDLAERVGAPGAARAVGAAMARNPLSIVVPCHRVVAARDLGGFGSGSALKRELLEREGALPPRLV